MTTCKEWTKERLRKRILELRLHGRRRKGRPRNSWMQEVTTGMRLRMGRQRGMEKEKYFTLGTEKCKNIKNLYINKLLINYNFS